MPANIRLQYSQYLYLIIISQMNQATSFFDASQLYGHKLDTAKSIRSFDGGKLKTDIINGHEFCPQKKRQGSLLCDDRDNVNICFEAGNIFVLQ